MAVKRGNRNSVTALKNYWENYDHSQSRNKYIPLRVSEEEHAAITEKAARLGISRVEFIVRACAKYAE